MNIKEALEKYIRSCQSNGLEKGTIYDKKHHLGLFSSYCKKKIENITLEDIEDFVASTNLTDIRKWRIRVDLRAFFRYLNENHYSDLTYTLIRNREPIFGIRPDLTQEEFEKIDRTCHELIKKYDDRRYIRWHAIHHFLYETGLRRTELANLPIENVDFEKHTFFVITAKTKKKRQGFFTSDLTQYLVVYRPKKYLFEVSKREVSEIIKRLVEKSGISRKISAHSYRHAFCTRLLTNGCPIQQTALLAGHQKVSTTMRYYHEANLRDAYDTYINPPTTYEFKHKVGIKSKYSVKLQITKNK